MVVHRRPLLPSGVARALIALLLVGCANGGEVTPQAGGSGGNSATSTGGGGVSGEGGHGCFSTEETCDGKCIDTSSHLEHCGACDHPCVAKSNATTQCVDGECLDTCAEGFVPGVAGCRNLVGAHQAYPTECVGCATSNSDTGDCSCPVDTTEAAYPSESDCPGVPMRSATALRLCMGSAATADSDFGGAYQLDDLPGWCGATNQCRVGNPLNGGACACPAGFDEVIALRTIIRLPCDNAEGGNVLYLCGNKDAPRTSFAGAYQLDDFAPQCRAPNPWTGDCSCPAGTVDRAYRAMVDGAQGLYGSTVHLCLP
ncbi:MAG: hypothetical protein U0271_22370 [Polyangiaceae bacterium]